MGYAAVVNGRPIMMPSILGGGGATVHWDLVTHFDCFGSQKLFLPLHWQPIRHIMLHILPVDWPHVGGQEVPQLVNVLPAAVSAAVQVPFVGAAAHAPFGGPIRQRTLGHTRCLLQAQKLFFAL